MKEWYYVDENENPQGVYSFEEIEQLIKTSVIKKSTYLWKEGFEDWKHLSEIEEFQDILKNIPPQIPKKDTSQSFTRGQDTASVSKEKFINEKIFWLTFLITGGGIFICFLIADILQPPELMTNLQSKGVVDLGGVDYFIYSLFNVLGIILSFIFGLFYLFYTFKMWKVLQNGETTITPGKAVGFTFIPLFNFYWVFKIWAEFPKIFNNFIQERAFKVEKIKESPNFFLMIAIGFILSGICYLITYLGAFVLGAYPIAWMFVVLKSAASINQLAEARDIKDKLPF